MDSPHEFERLRRLEELVLEAAETLKRFRRDHLDLTRKNRALGEENQGLKDEIRRLSAYPARQRRLRDRLEKIARKLEKAAG